MQYLINILKTGENQLMKRILGYAVQFDFSKYTSTLEEAWRMSIVGLTESIEKAWDFYGRIPEFGPDEDFRSDPVAGFGILEAQRHRERGISLRMFLGLYKYYRQSYMVQVKEAGLDPDREKEALHFLERVFDRIEIAYCDEWSGREKDKILLELQAANRYMTNEKNAYLTVFESVSSPIILLDTEGRIANMNYQAAHLIDTSIKPGQDYYNTSGMRQFVAMQGASSADSGKSVNIRFVGAKLREHFEWLSDSLEFSGINSNEAMVFEAEYKSPDGDKRFFEVQISRMLDVSEKFSGTLIILNDITERKSLLESLKYLATTDSLTGAHNRRHFFDLAQREFQRAQRYRREISLIEIDLDHFKEINDRFGHHTGDDVLKLFVKALNGMLRTSDTMGRLGGEEFAVVLPETGLEAARETAERILHGISQLRLANEQGEVRFTISIGVTEIRENEGNIEEMLKRADVAMYEAKNSGRNCVRVIS